ncbi:MAG: hypothetical protein HC934_03175 [Acaryochloridaceae cyanobacterium SU_2_1]|nr:hypothetical protein [Acaryochloridaceae cyanobacterium SU_2_1]NJM95394.1 hypothetical protein [Acaryochloridaceae cyanobacterium CSU_5_19]
MDYPRSTINRAVRAISCSPFQLCLFTKMCTQSVALQEIAGQAGRAAGFTQIIISERHTESAIAWLIQVGLLRREVDGQGLTDSFRLTPLGRQLIDQWQHQGRPLPQPSWRDRIQNLYQRWLRLPV